MNVLLLYAMCLANMFDKQTDEYVGILRLYRVSDVTMVYIY